jgi:hypothetical protein
MERYEHGWKRNGLRHGTGTGTVLFRARILTVSCPAFRKFGTARYGMVKALDTAQGYLYDEFKIAKYKVSLTSDIWSAGKHDKSYCTVTAHWITDDINFGT